MASNLSRELWIDLARDPPGAYRRLMREYPRVPALALAAIAVLVVSGCVEAAPSEPPAPTASAEPVFASEEEALAAATEAYAAYLAVSDEVARDGWTGTGALGDVAGGDALKEDIRIAANFFDRGYIQEGSSAFDSMSIQQSTTDSSDLIITTYVCLDVSAVDILDADGRSVVPGDRADRYPLELMFATDSSIGRGFILVRSDSWSGTDFCSR